MGLKNIIKTMHNLLDKIVKDLKKTERGNKAASQRVRTGTVRLSKISKIFRKESVVEEKKTKKCKKKKKATPKKSKKKSKKKKR